MDIITILQIGLGILLVIMVIDSFRPVKNLEHLSEQEFKERMKKPENVVLVDVRNPYEFQTKHIKGAINLPLSQIRRKKVDIPTDKDVILYCQTGVRSKQAAKVLRRRNKEMPIAHLQGGLFSIKTSTDIQPKKQK
jgi:rhodanese-related sulfurtransferase